MLKNNPLLQTNAKGTSKTGALRTMGTLDIVDGMFSIYRSHLPLFLSIAAVYFVLTFGLKMSAALFSLSGWLANVFDACGSLVIGAVCFGSLTFASAQCYLGVSITPILALRQAFRRFWPHLGTSILWRIAVFGLWVTFWFAGTAYKSPEGIIAALFAVISIGMPVGAYFGIRWGFHTVLVLFEERSVRQALKRSAELVEGTWWRVFGITVAIYALGIAIQWILKFALKCVLMFAGVMTKASFLDILWQIVNDPSPDETGLLTYAIQECINLGTSALVISIYNIGITLLYFDLRIRKEGFDIEMMARNESEN